VNDLPEMNYVGGLQLGAQKLNGIRVDLEQDKLIDFRIKATSEWPDADYADVRVRIDGRERTYTLTDFLTRLGFIEVQGA